MVSVVDLVIAWREMSRQIKQKRIKDAQYRVLVGSDLRYDIIRDLVNAARADVVIDITLKDGARLQIKHKDDSVEWPPKSELY